MQSYKSDHFIYNLFSLVIKFLFLSQFTVAYLHLANPVLVYIDGMKKNAWGRIVTIGSVNQYNQHPELSLYGITKAAQKKMTENFAPLFAPYGITINNIAPGVIETPRNTEALSDEVFKQKIIENIPCGYIGQPQDISPAVLLLCSDEGRYITGSEIIIDGGMRL